ncbi:MAG TPA: diguanylate cyclase [Clostridia bacterium]|nr:diguanylate cyclase [Clostridia bacterium]
MKIGEFAELNNVTTKMLRHYDEIGLLKPACIDEVTGYRSYDTDQSHYLNWVIILKNLDFPLSQIKDMLSGPVDGQKMIRELILKRIEISSTLNERIQMKIEIDNLIKILEKEGFKMDRKIDLLSITQDSVHEVKKNIPNMEMFLESALAIADLCQDDGSIAALRFDICHFKQVNDDYGFEVGDKVIVACYNIIKSNIEKYLVDSSLGRAHGDEFVVFAKAGKESVENTALSIIHDMDRYDFSSIGCEKQMGCYIGGVVGLNKDVSSIRSMIEQSIESINEAREKGKNSVVVRTLTPKV